MRMFAAVGQAPSFTTLYNRPEPYRFKEGEFELSWLGDVLIEMKVAGFGRSF